MTMKLTLTKRRRLLQGIYTRRKYPCKKLGVKDGGGGGVCAKGAYCQDLMKTLAIGCLHKGKIPMQEIGRGGLRKRGVFSGAYGTHIVTALEVACRT